MRTVYLDKNIYSYFAKDPIDAPFDILMKELRDSKDFLVTYSYAHIEDLLQSENEEKNLSDLQIIESFAHNNYCYYDNDLKKYCYGYYSPKEIYDCQEDILPVIDELVNGFDLSSFLSEEMKESLSKMKASWIENNTHNNIDEKNLKLIGSFFPTNIHELSIEEIFRNSYNGLRAFSKDNSIYRSLRAYNYNNINKGQYGINLDTNEITKDIKDSPFQKSLFDLVYATLKQQNGEEVFRFDFHTMAYIMLDMLGFDRDTKVKTNNLYVDANHSYYGAHFDYVVSNDTGFVTKSRVLYKMLGIDTKVLYPNEFTDELEKLKTYRFESAEELMETIYNELKTEDFIKISNELDSQTYQYRFSVNFLFYFDTLLKSVNSKSNVEYILYKSYNKYLENRIPVRIISQVIEKCLSLFGDDIEKKGYLDIHKEIECLDNDTNCILRIWQFDTKVLILEMAARKLCLSFAHGKLEDTSEIT